MNEAKYQAAKYLNELDNKHKIIGEEIAAVEKMLANARAMQALTAQMIAGQRAAIAALPD